MRSQISSRNLLITEFFGESVNIPVFKTTEKKSLSKTEIALTVYYNLKESWDGLKNQYLGMIDREIPLEDFLISYSEDNLKPNQIYTFTKTGRKRNYTYQVEFYGNFRGSPFQLKHIERLVELKKENSREIKTLCIHTAIHSQALFLSHKDTSDFAIYNVVPFAFPHSSEYIKYYTQEKYLYPLIVTKIIEPTTEEYFIINGLPTIFRRRCTADYKIKAPLQIYKELGMELTQQKGICFGQSSKRNQYAVSGEIKAEDPMTKSSELDLKFKPKKYVIPRHNENSPEILDHAIEEITENVIESETKKYANALIKRIEKFTIIQDLPIYYMSVKEQEKLVESASIKENPLK